MAYEKTTWVDGETEIDAQKLNKMEEGIVEASQTGGILTGSIVAYDGDTIPEGYEEVEKPKDEELDNELNKINKTLEYSLTPKGSRYDNYGTDNLDYNSYTKAGVFRLNGGENLNAPPNTISTGGVLLVFNAFEKLSNTVFVQIYLASSGGFGYIRTCWYGTWSTWKNLY